MNRLSLIFLIIGLILIISSFFNRKRKQKRSYVYSNTKFATILSKLKNSKFINIIINEKTPSNIKLLNKLNIINQCKQAEKLNYNNQTNKNQFNKIKSPKEQLVNIFIYQLTIFLLVTIVGFIMNKSLNKIVVNETLNSGNIHITTQYRVSTDDASSILNYIGEDYKIYIKTDNVDKLKERIYDYILENKLSIEQDTAYLICNVYLQAYQEGIFSSKEILTIILAGIVSTLLVKIYINLKFKICNVKLISEFYSMELLALLHMNRDELNVYEIITELNKYSIYLKPYFTRCLNRYSSDPNIALDKLMNEVNNESFTSFILILKSCLDKSKNINSEVLQLQRKLRFLNDKIENDKSLEFKKLYLTAAQFPLILSCVVNMLLPFLSKLSINNIL